MYQLLLMYSKSNGREYTENTVVQPNGVWEGNIHFCQISDFLWQFYAFSNFSLIFKWPKSEETSIGTFSSIIMYKSRFLPTKKEKLNLWLRRISVAIVTFLEIKSRFCRGIFYLPHFFSPVFMFSSNSCNFVVTFSSIIFKIISNSFSIPLKLLWLKIKNKWITFTCAIILQFFPNFLWRRLTNFTSGSSPSPVSSSS